MKALLVKNINNGIYYYKDSIKIKGAHKNIRGNVSGIRGDINDCEITPEERKKGVSIQELIKP